MKNKICAVVLAATLLFQVASLRPQRAHGVIGVATGDVLMTVLGVMYLGLGLGAFTYSAVDTEGFRRFDHYLDPTVLVVAGGAVLAGIVFLDEERGTASFEALTPAVVAGAQLTEDEAAAYQLELPELNRALYAAAGDLLGLGVSSVAAALSHGEAWQARAAGLMPETRGALTKLGVYLRAQAAASAR